MARIGKKLMQSSASYRGMEIYTLIDLMGGQTTEKGKPDRTLCGGR